MSQIADKSSFPNVFTVSPFINCVLKMSSFGSPFKNPKCKEQSGTYLTRKRLLAFFILAIVSRHPRPTREGLKALPESPTEDWGKLHSKPLPSPGFPVGHTTTDVIDVFKGRDDLFVMGDNDDRGFNLTCNIVQKSESLSERVDGSGRITPHANPCS
ncbi:hypothetical protein [Desulfonatronum thiodismutans]|nr:hypothetical protein [Desulfonatronum thiodismutans]